MDRHPQGLDPELTEAIIGTLLDPILILDENLSVIVASRSFYDTFSLEYKDIQGKRLQDLGTGEWNIADLITKLGKVIPDQAPVTEYEILQTTPKSGKRTLVINAHEIKFSSTRHNLLLAITDVTDQRKLHADRDRLMEQKDLLLKEMRHRIANSLQLIASVILLKAGTVKSEESRQHLEDAHDRILSIATVQRNLDPTGDDSVVPITLYLKTLCESLARSMIGGRKPITLKVIGDEGVATPDQAIALGLTTTELVINCLKHAFPSGEGNIRVLYKSDDGGWRLSIEDDGVGLAATTTPRSAEGLGTNIVDSLAKQLDAKVTRESSDKGTTVTITH